MPPELPSEATWAEGYRRQREAKASADEVERARAEKETSEALERTRMETLINKALALSQALPAVKPDQPDGWPQSEWIASGDKAEYDGHVLTCKVNLTWPTTYKSCEGVVIMGVRWEDENGVMAVMPRPWLGFCPSGITMDSKNTAQPFRPFIFDMAMQPPRFLWPDALLSDSPVLDDAERCLRKLEEAYRQSQPSSNPD